MQADWRDTWRFLRRAFDLLLLAGAVCFAAQIAIVGKGMMQ